MKEDLLQSLRVEFEGLKEKVSKHNKEAEELSLLLKENNVSRFVELSKTDVKKILKKESYEEKVEELLSIYIEYLNSVNECTNGIYCHLGSDLPIYLMKTGKYYVAKIINPFKKSEKGSLYKNLECSIDSVVLPMSKKDEFEKEHIIIDTKDYDSTQKEFVINAIQLGQEEAVKRIIKKYKKQ